MVRRSLTIQVDHRTLSAFERYAAINRKTMSEIARERIDFPQIIEELRQLEREQPDRETDVMHSCPVLLVPLLAEDLAAHAGGWVFSQPAAIVVAVLAAAAACYALYWFAKLHERTITTATADMKLSVREISQAFAEDQKRDQDVFVREQEKNRELLLTLLSQRPAGNSI